ncbi:hypothetical protein STCU_10573 [Strigomonas culicis]|uniref:Uncharacterized protein n=1 Tax=Strigomonas culicis TaxID=28005 RepID=S9TMF3_9TRYP|nr:hypothetical protein STCU_10573 [Strigomonas culicis]|eukprot:EPY17513.1 hypothetical protein STCU_10573 [Strigomonas culicis]
MSLAIKDDPRNYDLSPILSGDHTAIPRREEEPQMTSLPSLESNCSNVLTSSLGDVLPPRFQSVCNRTVKTCGTTATEGGCTSAPSTYISADRVMEATAAQDDGSFLPPSYSTAHRIIPCGSMY